MNIMNMIFQYTDCIIGTQRLYYNNQFFFSGKTFFFRVFIKEDDRRKKKLHNTWENFRLFLGSFYLFFFFENLMYRFYINVIPMYIYTCDDLKQQNERNESKWLYHVLCAYLYVFFASFFRNIIFCSI